MRQNQIPLLPGAIETARHTRDDAWRDLQRLLPEKRWKVYECVWMWHREATHRRNVAPEEAGHNYRGSMTNREISNVLYWPINSVTGRVLELRNVGILVPGPMRHRPYKDADGRQRYSKEQSWIPLPPADALSIANRCKPADYQRKPKATAE